MVESASTGYIKERERVESRAFSLILIGAPTSGKSSFATFISETLHLPVLPGSGIVDPQSIPQDGSLVDDSIFGESLQRILRDGPPTGYIFDGIPRTPAQAQIIADWSRRNSFPLHVIDLQLSEAEILDRTQNREVCPVCKESYHERIKPSVRPHQCDLDQAVLMKRVDDEESITKKRVRKFNNERESILSELAGSNAVVHTIDSNGPISQTSRGVFRELSPLAFDDPELAARYFELKDLCQDLDIDFVLISGACGYIYRGRRPLKDLDIVVPSLADLQKIAQASGKKVETIESSYANSHYLNYSSGVELVSDVSVRYREDEQENLVPFDFSRLREDSKVVRFFGEGCRIMSPEWLIAFKLCLGRSGIDDFGHNKNDYSDAFDVTISQPVDYDKLTQIARRIGAQKRIESGLEIVRSSGY